LKRFFLLSRVAGYVAIAGCGGYGGDATLILWRWKRFLSEPLGDPTASTSFLFEDRESG